ncbi:site-specific integrase [Arenibacter sp. ARW7G5Y1]|uniref:site-specific integrase n=1 Tax=Arenibacter sp. ARW7G5Y1 TaxID=2135619 RepID=UPI000D752E17|nr:site-specific integrase [Arenibacter sp. ARW7G5Y1]PXX27317.1 site-specific recombinase XerD [Arenibacter sp. ARW7G5Y1]
MLENSRLSVVFVVRKLTSKIDTIKIYARVTVDGKRAEFNLNRELPVSLWDEKRKRGKGFSKYVISLNKYMDQVFTGLHEAHRQLLQEEVEITSARIKARFLGEDDRGKSLLDLISYHNTSMISVLRKGTMKNYYSTERCIKEFLNEKMGVEDIPLKKLNYGFIVDFEQYIRKYKPATRMGCTNNGAMKHMERLKKMSRLAVKLEWLEKDPFINYKLRFEKTERQFLTERELQLIEETTFNVPSTQHVKDLFIFACYTGLSFIDVSELKIDHLVKGMDGNDWLYTKRTKTDEPLKIPLLPKAMEIIDKYRDNDSLLKSGRLLPIYSNQMINRTLRDIATACGIRKKITFHVARHTFATAITLSNGVPIETVSKLLGHTKLSTTQIYARVVEKKVGEDMQNLMATMKLKKVRAGEVS